MSIDLYHNPRCSKSREALQLLEDRGVEVEVIEYLKEPPDAIELRAILTLLGMGPRDIIRTKEAPYKELGLDDPSMSDDALIDAMVANPILIERPIAVTPQKARLGRPPEKVLELL